MLKIENLNVNRDRVKILNDVNLEVKKGQIVVLMGKNGSGKSTLSNVLAGNPDFEIESGKIYFDGEEITEMSVDERAKKGLFLSFQHPLAIPGVSVSNFLRTAYNSVKEKISVLDFKRLIESRAEELHIDLKLLGRSLNEDFSGGEKKKIEMLQLSLLKPKLAILDETDSGLDLSALDIVAKAIKKENDEGMAVLIITHYNRFLEYIKPEKVYLIDEGKIVKEGDYDLALKLEKEGYGILNE
jgi:Fe-S cluster assembly ATP-binding protein